jgi:hypothetical protein
MTATDKPWLTFNVEASSLAELNIGIICACAPSLKTVIRSFYRDVSTGGNSKFTASQVYLTSKLGDHHQSSDDRRSIVSRRTFDPSVRRSRVRSIAAFPDLHESHMEDEEKQAYHDKIMTEAVANSSSPHRQWNEYSYEVPPGQAIPLSPMVPSPTYNAEPIPSARIVIRKSPVIIQPSSEFDAEFLASGRSTAQSFVEATVQRMVLPTIPSEPSSVIFINNENGKEEFVRVRYPSALGTRSSKNDLRSQNSVGSKMKHESAQQSSLPAGLTPFSPVHGTPASPGRPVGPFAPNILQSQWLEPPKQEKGSVRRALQAVKMEQVIRTRSQLGMLPRDFHQDISILESPSVSEFSFTENEYGESSNPERLQHVRSEPALYSPAKLVAIDAAMPPNAAPAISVNLPPSSVLINPLQTTYSPFPARPWTPSPAIRPGTAPSMGSANFSKPFTTLKRSPSATRPHTSAMGTSENLPPFSTNERPAWNSVVGGSVGPLNGGSIGRTRVRRVL